MLKIFISLLLIFKISLLFSQHKNQEQITLVFFNADNLYDTHNDQGTYDDRFTPEGEMVWNSERFEQKINGISEMLSSINGTGLPDIIGLAEIENTRVIQEILNTRNFRRSEYEIIHIEGENNTEAALLIKDGLLDVTESRIITPDERMTDDNDNSTILYVKGNLNGEAIHFFINRWPGRTGGVESSEFKRIGSAVAVRKEIDNILNFEKDARIIVMGSFNDEPSNRSLMLMLNATNKRKNISYRDLFNLFYDKHNIGDEGTVLVNGIWQMYDQIIVSPSFLKPGSNIMLGFESGRIYRDFQVNESSRFNGTYRGNEYTGGISSHLPVYMMLISSGK